MKRLSILTLLMLGVGFYFTGCYHDVILPDVAVDPDGPPKAVIFSTELAPLFATHCALAGCHVSGNHKPYMAADISYQQIVNGGYINTSIPKASILYNKINGEMKEYIPSASDRQKVYDWIRNGAPNN